MKGGKRGQPRETDATSQLDRSNDTATDPVIAAAHQSVRCSATERSLSRDDQNVGRLLAGDALIDYLASVMESLAERIDELEQRLDDLDRPGGVVTELQCGLGVVVGVLDGLRPAGVMKVAS